MEKYIEDWFYVIKNCSVENTYKMGWSKSIVECCLENPNLNLISFDRISEKMFKYYWNQTIFFDLQQSPNPNKPPKFITYVKDQIEYYKKQFGNKPELYDRISHQLNIDIKHLSSILKQDVSHRFLKVSGDEFDLYELNQKDRTVRVYHPDKLKEYSDILFYSINYRWSQILENFNSSPRISQKVRVVDFSESKDLKRKPLSKFKRYLDLISTKCSICGKELNGDISIDHVIPWSYMYSDDLWNLVYVHQGCNSSKSNILPTETTIENLKRRNLLLLKVLNENGIEDKHFSELELSVEKDFPMKFWIGFKG